MDSIAEIYKELIQRELVKILNKTCAGAIGVKCTDLFVSHHICRFNFDRDLHCGTSGFIGYFPAAYLIPDQAMNWYPAYFTQRLRETTLELGYSVQFLQDESTVEKKLGEHVNTVTTYTNVFGD